MRRLDRTYPRLRRAAGRPLWPGAAEGPRHQVTGNKCEPDLTLSMADIGCLEGGESDGPISTCASRPRAAAVPHRGRPRRRRPAGLPGHVGDEFRQDPGGRPEPGRPLPADGGIPVDAPAAAVVPRRQVRHLHPLGHLLGAGLGARRPGIRRVALAQHGQQVRPDLSARDVAVRGVSHLRPVHPAVHREQVRSPGLGGAVRAGRGAVLRAGHQAPRGFRPVPDLGQPPGLGLHGTPPRPGPGAVRRGETVRAVAEAGHLLLASPHPSTPRISPSRRTSGKRPRGSARSRSATTRPPRTARTGTSCSISARGPTERSRRSWPTG